MYPITCPITFGPLEFPVSTKFLVINHLEICVYRISHVRFDDVRNSTKLKYISSHLILGLQYLNEYVKIFFLTKP